MTKDQTDALTDFILETAERLELPIVRAAAARDIAVQMTTILEEIRDGLDWALEYTDGLGRKR